MNALIVLETTTFGDGDEHFSAGDKGVENPHSNFSHTHTHTRSLLSTVVFIDKFPFRLCSTLLICVCVPLCLR